MRLALIFAGLLLPAAALAQPPTSAVAPAAAVPPPISFDMIHPALIQATCEVEKHCGCGQGVDHCLKNLSGANLSTATMACLAFQPCSVMCENDKAGEPGTKLHDMCLTPKAQATIEPAFKRANVEATCKAARACGCEEKTEAACVEHIMTTLNNVDGAYFACTAAQPCADLCDPKSVEPGGGLEQRCMAPALAAHKAKVHRQEADLYRQMLKQQKVHNLNMQIIRSMGGTSTRTQVYDAKGNYLRTE